MDGPKPFSVLVNLDGLKFNCRFRIKPKYLEDSIPYYCVARVTLVLSRFFFFLCRRCRLIPGNWQGSNLCGFYGKCGPQAGLMNMVLHFEKLRRTLAWGQKGWFCLSMSHSPWCAKSSSVR